MIYIWLQILCRVQPCIKTFPAQQALRYTIRYTLLTRPEDIRLSSVEAFIEGQFRRSYNGEIPIAESISSPRIEFIGRVSSLFVSYHILTVQRKIKYACRSFILSFYDNFPRDAVISFSHRCHFNTLRWERPSADRCDENSRISIIRTDT